MTAQQDQANQKKDEVKAGAPAGGQSDEDDDEDEEEQAPAPTLESLAADLARTKAALKRANTEARKLRLASKQEDKPKEEDKSSAEIEKLRVELKKRDAVTALLATPDFNGNAKAAARAVKTFDSLDPEDLEAEIEAYKEDNPAMFKRKKRVETPAGTQRGSGSNDDASKGGGPLSEASKAMLGMGRRR